MTTRIFKVYKVRRLFGGLKWLGDIKAKNDIEASRIARIKYPNESILKIVPSGYKK